MGPPSFSLIDNILCNDIGGTVDSTSGLLINDISDHKMIFTHLPNDSYKNKVNKFIVMEIGYEPADLTVHPPPQNDRGWVHYFRIGV